MGNESGEESALVRRLQNGDTEARSALLEYHRTRLLHLVRLRMDARLKHRSDA